MADESDNPPFPVGRASNIAIQATWAQKGQPKRTGASVIVFRTEDDLQKPSCSRTCNASG
jgi:hypothetical protein